MKVLKYTILATFCLLISCNQKNENEFTYSEFKEALYYNESSGSFSDLGNLEMCINRWGEPKYVKSIGTMSDLYGTNSKLQTIVFKWSNIEVDNKHVEIYFEMDDSGKTINDVFNRSIRSLNAKHAIVKEFRLTN